MLFILHIKGSASDVQDIVKYLPVMPGRQCLLIHLLYPLLPLYHWFDLSLLFSFSHSVPSTSFLLKRILYHVCHHHGLYCTPITPFVVRPLQACENDNDLLFKWDCKHVQRMRRAACGSGCPSCRLHRMNSQGQC